METLLEPSRATASPEKEAEPAYPGSGYEHHPRPLEQTDPELAEHFRLIANGIHPVIDALSIGARNIVISCKNGDRIFATVHGVITIDKDGRRTAKMLDRNDPCGCGSGRKYKKCCLSKR